MLRVIREVRPRWVVGENVYGLVNWNGGLVLDTVCLDLENEGFQVIPVVLPAASVNAPHKRDRIFFVAYSGACEHRGKPTEIHGTAEEKNGCGDEQSPSPWKQIQLPFEPGSLFGDVTDTKGEGSREFSSENSGRENGRLDYYGQNEYAADAMRPRGEQDNWKGESEFFDEDGKAANWQNFPTQSPLCSGDDGLPTRLDGITFSAWRNKSIMGYGNAVVPKVVYQIFKSIELYEQQRTDQMGDMDAPEGRMHGMEEQQLGR
jgi:DNA (cytosine-5)-methyltransferase 1